MDSAVIAFQLLEAYEMHGSIVVGKIIGLILDFFFNDIRCYK